VAHLVMHRATTRTFSLTLTNTAGSPLDLTDATLQFIAKHSLSDEDADAVVDVAADIDDDPETGLATVTIPKEDTEDLPQAQYTALFYALVRTVGGEPDVVDDGMLVVRANVDAE